MPADSLAEAISRLYGEEISFRQMRQAESPAPDPLAGIPADEIRKRDYQLSVDRRWAVIKRNLAKVYREVRTRGGWVTIDSAGNQING